MPDRLLPVNKYRCDSSTNADVICLSSNSTGTVKEATEERQKSCTVFQYRSCLRGGYYTKTDQIQKAKSMTA